MNSMQFLEILSEVKKQQAHHESIMMLSFLVGIVLGFVILTVIIWAIEKWRLL